MAESTHNPNSIACIQWEMLLADALDGLLRPEDQALFSAHRSVCPACAALFEEASRGREWLEFLSPEPEVPVGLLDRILAQTGPGQLDGYGLMPAGSNVLPMPQPWQQPGFMAGIRRFAEPRLLMTAAMAFFSIALTINMTGVRFNSMRLADMRPTAVRSFMERRLTMASTPIIRYYDHLRFVNEVQSTVRQLRRATQSEDSNPEPNVVTPGESKQIPARKQRTTPDNSPQQSVNPAPALNNSNNNMEASRTFQGPSRAFRRLQISNTTTKSGLRSKVWTA
jgi:hypothetical protein